MDDEKHLIRRLGAVTIDSLLANFVQAAAIAPMAFFVATADMENDPQATTVAVILSIGAMLIAFGSIGLFIVRDTWRSPGKRLFGLEVIDLRSGERCSFMQAGMRGGVYIMLGIIDMLVPVFRADGRRVGDLAANTQVVRRRV